MPPSIAENRNITQAKGEFGGILCFNLRKKCRTKVKLKKDFEGEIIFKTEPEQAWTQRKAILQYSIKFFPNAEVNLVILKSFFICNIWPCFSCSSADFFADPDASMSFEYIFEHEILQEWQIYISKWKSKVYVKLINHCSIAYNRNIRNHLKIPKK